MVAVAQIDIVGIRMLASFRPACARGRTDFPACGTFEGRRMNAFITLNTTALAPIAKASVKTAAMVNPGDLRNWRRANRRS